MLDAEPQTPVSSCQLHVRQVMLACLSCEPVRLMFQFIAICVQGLHSCSPVKAS